jgi:hypothetical protein
MIICILGLAMTGAAAVFSVLCSRSGRPARCAALSAILGASGAFLLGAAPAETVLASTAFLTVSWAAVVSSRDQD